MVLLQNILLRIVVLTGGVIVGALAEGPVTLVTVGSNVETGGVMVPIVVG